MNPKEMFRIEHNEDHMAVVFIDMEAAERSLTVRLFPVRGEHDGPREISVAWANVPEGSDPVALAVSIRNAVK